NITPEIRMNFFLLLKKDFFSCILIIFFCVSYYTTIEKTKGFQEFSLLGRERVVSMGYSWKRMDF
ncbi:hypothetical protein KGY73_11250, partial [bacterium]|nr:hypothetical protein [bacterium]